MDIVAEQIRDWFSTPEGGLFGLLAQTRENLPTMPPAHAVVMEQEPDEQALMAAYAAGDDRAFDTLFRLLAPRLIAFFRRSINDPSLCEDLLQTTFVRLHAARDRYRPESPLRPWLFTIAARVRIDELRRRHRRPTSTSDDEIDRLEAEVDPDHGGLGIDREARIHSVRDALDALPPAQRMVVHLHRFEGLSFAEIGEVIGISAGAARIRAFRAYALLRERLRPLIQEET
ncbi:MAG TPA: RNA polymerase sigma factor [Polyangiales bacterium]|nr:RNA polymerase sigma factor [Polyangiales bacterium]